MDIARLMDHTRIMEALTKAMSGQTITNSFQEEVKNLKDFLREKLGLSELDILDIPNALKLIEKSRLDQNTEGNNK